MPYGNKMQNCTEREHRQKDLRELVWKERNKKRTGKQVCYQIFSSFFLNVRIVAIYFSIWFEVSRKKVALFVLRLASSVLLWTNSRMCVTSAIA